MPNAFAYFMLAVWPLVTLALFLRLPPGRAFVIAMVAGYLLLPPAPANFDFPLLPPLGKSNIPTLSALAAWLLTRRERLSLLPRGRMVRLLMVVFVFSPVLTFLTNREPVFFGPIGLPGMRPFEAFALTVQQGVVLIAFLMARALLTGPEAPERADGARLIALALFVGGLAYAGPMLIEVRLSPQLNNWVYGYFQHLFEQAIRGGGFRPLVFLNHGLWAAFFAMSAFVAGLALWRASPAGRGGFYLLASGLLGVVLVLCKTLGALVYGVFLLPLVLAMRGLWQVRIAALIGLVAFAYPVFKSADLVPTQFLLTQAARVSAERANSLQFRFENEDVLFARAQRKPAFGWGIWGRNQIIDPQTGNFRTVTDGRWIITLGVYGWLGYLAEFGLLLAPLLALWRRARRAEAELPALAGPLALLLAVNLIDLIPNATLTPLTWLIAGALLGVAERAHAAAPASEQDSDAPSPALKTVLG